MPFVTSKITGTLQCSLQLSLAISNKKCKKNYKITEYNYTVFEMCSKKTRCSVGREKKSRPQEIIRGRGWFVIVCVCFFMPDPEKGRYKDWGIIHSLDIWHAAKNLTKKLHVVREKIS